LKIQEKNRKKTHTKTYTEYVHAIQP